MATQLQTREPLESQAKLFTQVDLLYDEGKCNYRLLWGHPHKLVHEEYIRGQITRKKAFFAPGDIFALDLWERNEYGTRNWVVYVLQAVGAGEEAVAVPQVKPAAKVLLEARGKDRAQQALRLLAEIEARTDPTMLPPERFLLTDFRLNAMTTKELRRSNAK